MKKSKTRRYLPTLIWTDSEVYGRYGSKPNQPQRGFAYRTTPRHRITVLEMRLIEARGEDVFMEV